MLSGIIVTSRDGIYWKVLDTSHPTGSLINTINWIESDRPLGSEKNVKVTAIYRRVKRERIPTENSDSFFSCTSAKLLLTERQRTFLRDTIVALQNRDLYELVRLNAKTIRGAPKKEVARQVWKVLKKGVFPDNPYLLLLVDMVFKSIDWSDIKAPCLSAIIKTCAKSTYKWIPNLIIGYIAGVDVESSGPIVMATLYLIMFFAGNIMENSGVNQAIADVMKNSTQSLLRQIEESL